ncbi:hypothetical protein PsorP6_018833 [Peronosclerospora sorghi]|nr:hypothetical protein PsorP6_018833 [Peronosclerospora sorghi]
MFQNANITYSSGGKPLSNDQGRWAYSPSSSTKVSTVRWNYSTAPHLPLQPNRFRDFPTYLRKDLFQVCGLVETCWIKITYWPYLSQSTFLSPSYLGFSTLCRRRLKCELSTAITFTTGPALISSFSRGRGTESDGVNVEPGY